MGLDNFDTSDEGGTKPTNEDEVYDDFGIDKDKLEEKRKNKYVDYYPEATLEQGWSYRDAVAVECVCDNRLIIDLRSIEECNCGRVYANTVRSTVMVSRKE